MKKCEGLLQVVVMETVTEGMVKIEDKKRSIVKACDSSDNTERYFDM